MESLSTGIDRLSEEMQSDQELGRSLHASKRESQQYPEYETIAVLQSN